MSIFIIKLQRQRKLRPRAWTTALQAPALAVSPWSQRFPFILLNYNSAPPLLLGADVGQLFSSWPAFTPGGGILRISWAIALLCVVWDLQKSVTILEGSCQPWIRCWKLALCIGTIGAGRPMLVLEEEKGQPGPWRDRRHTGRKSIMFSSWEVLKLFTLRVYHYPLSSGFMSFLLPFLSQFTLPLSLTSLSIPFFFVFIITLYSLPFFTHSFLLSSEYAKAYIMWDWEMG